MQTEHPSISTIDLATPGLQPRATTQTGKRQFGLRAFTSMLLAMSFTVMMVSGAVLFLTPRGRTANWTGWTMLGLDKHEWSSIHVNNSILFVALAVTHLVLNWSVLLNYLRKKKVPGVNKKKELAVALVVAAVCFAGPIFSVPPFSSVMSLNEDVKDYWEQDTVRNNVQPPVPHAEELTLAELAEHVGLTSEQLSTTLVAQGYEVSDAKLTIGQIADQKQATPSELFGAIRDEYPGSRGWGRIGATHDGEASELGRGAGRQGGGDALGSGGGWGGGGGGGRGMGQGRGMGRGRGMGQGQGMGQGGWQGEGW